MTLETPAVVLVKLHYVTDSKAFVLSSFRDTFVCCQSGMIKQIIIYIIHDFCIKLSTFLISCGSFCLVLKAREIIWIYSLLQ